MTQPNEEAASPHVAHSGHKPLFAIRYGIVFAAGLTAGLILSGHLFRHGCHVRLTMPFLLETTCPGQFEEQISFGRSPSARHLSDALQIAMQETRGFTDSRLFVDERILASPAASRVVHPPEGSKSVIRLLQQLLAEADAESELRICLPPSGGIAIEPRHEAP